MPVLKSKKTAGFTQIDNATIRNADLSLRAKGLLLVMMSCPAEWQFNMVWLKKQSSDGKQAHQSALAELLAQGYVTRQRQRDAAGRWTWLYHVADAIHGPTMDGKPVHGEPATRKKEFTKKDLKKSEVYSAPDESEVENIYTTAPKIAAREDNVVPDFVPDPPAADDVTPAHINVPPEENAPFERVALLMPVPDLASRPLQPADSPEYAVLTSLIGKQLETYLGELTKTGQRSREDWKRLSFTELQHLKAVVLREAGATGMLVPTLAARGLDRLIGALPRPKQQDNVYAGGAAYLPLPAKHSLPETPQEPEQGKFRPGARYRRKGQAEVVTLIETEVVKNRHGQGAQWVLSDGSRMAVVDLVLKFEFLGHGTPIS